jgi:hypothetical protein
MQRLNEIVNNFDNLFADKEGTRKKLAQLEKAVSHNYHNHLVKIIA